MESLRAVLYALLSVADMGKAPSAVPKCVYSGREFAESSGMAGTRLCPHGEAGGAT